MNFSSVKNNRGLTLAELLVALGISSILLVFVVTGSLFVQNYLNSWQRKDKVVEELSFVIAELSKTIAGSRFLNLYPDSLVCYSKTQERTVYGWHDRNLLQNGQVLTRVGLRLDTLAITTMELRKTEDSVILIRGQNATHPTLYEIFVVVSDYNRLTDSLRSVVKNEHAAIKYHQK